MGLKPISELKEGDVFQFPGCKAAFEVVGPHKHGTEYKSAKGVSFTCRAETKVEV